MTYDEIAREIIALPPEGQRQVERLITQLRTVYEKQLDETTQLGSSDSDFFGMWRDREDLQDSTAWVRTLRDQQW